jgi:hypothetical protein
VDKTFAAIEKLKEVELELHRLKNYAEMMNRSVEAKRKWQSLTDAEIKEILDCGRPNLINIKKAEQKLKEKNT